MNTTNRITPIRTEFQATSEIVGIARDAVNRAHSDGYTSGEKVGYAMAVKQHSAAVNSAMGLGFIIGLAAGSTLTLIVLRWLSA